MEIAENGLASGSVRDLPPSKRFKYVGAQLGSAPCVVLPAKKRVFPPPPAEEAAVAVCLPVKKRAIVAPCPEAQAAPVPVCLPAKKRAIVPPPPEDAAPVCLPAKKRPCAPPADAVLPACLPAKKCVGAPPPPPDAVASTCVLAKKRVHAPAPRDAAASSAPLCPPANSRVRTAAPAGTVAWTCGMAKKRIPEPGPRQDAVRSVPVCLPANKRVMPPPSVEADGSRFGTAKEARPQGSNKHNGGSAINPRVANGAEGCSRGKELKKPEKPANPKGIKEQVSMKPVKPRSPSKSKFLEKEASKVVNGKQSEVVAEVREKSDKSANTKGGALKEESRNGPAEGRARGKEINKLEKPINPRGIKEQVSVKPSKPISLDLSEDLEKKACKIVNGKQSEFVEVCKKSDEAADVKGAVPKEEQRTGADAVAQEREQEAVEEDDGVLCAVCGSTDGDPSDPIVFCDGCDLMVHASCYGNPLAQAIPDGDWFCSLCSAKKSKPAVLPSCCLCPARGGAMKRTTEGQWAHISCALLVPEVFFRDPDGRDGVDCSRVPAHRFAKDCYICESNNGCALECSQPKCSLGFHVTCGLDAGLCIEYREGKGGAIVAGFCREHSELWEKVKSCITSITCGNQCYSCFVVIWQYSNNIVMK
jgi:NuA3 HAT complex component NTO1